MISDLLPETDPAGPGRKSYLFSDPGLGSPLEELRLIFEKKLRTAENLGENDKARASREAYELARKRLSASLGVEPERL